MVRSADRGYDFGSIRYNASDAKEFTVHIVDYWWHRVHLVGFASKRIPWKRTLITFVMTAAGCLRIYRRLYICTVCGGGARADLLPHQWVHIIWFFASMAKLSWPPTWLRWGVPCYVFASTCTFVHVVRAMVRVWLRTAG